MDSEEVYRLWRMIIQKGKKQLLEEFRWAN